jgi:hypothetical protein
LTTVALALKTTHWGIATLLKQGHWLLTDDDAKLYAQHVKAVARHYPIAVTQKMLDWYGLIQMMAVTEGVRIATSYGNAKARRSQSRQPPGTPGLGATVFQFRANPQGQPAAPPAAAVSGSAGRVTPPDATPMQPDGGGVEGFTGDGVDAPIGGP